MLGTLLFLVYALDWVVEICRFLLIYLLGLKGSIWIQFKELCCVVCLQDCITLQHLSIQPLLRLVLVQPDCVQLALFTPTPFPDPNA